MTGQVLTHRAVVAGVAAGGALVGLSGAAQMSQAWVDFAHRGDPSSAGRHWQRYDPERRATIVFDTATRVVEDPDRAARPLLAA